MQYLEASLVFCFFGAMWFLKSYYDEDERLDEISPYVAMALEYERDEFDEWAVNRYV